MENTSSNNHSAESTSNGPVAPLTNGHSHVVNEQNAALLPQLESFERMMKLPVVEAAWHQSQDVYGKVKGKSTRSEYAMSRKRSIGDHQDNIHTNKFSLW